MGIKDSLHKKKEERGKDYPGSDPDHLLKEGYKRRCSSAEDTSNAIPSVAPLLQPSLLWKSHTGCIVSCAARTFCPRKEKAEKSQVNHSLLERLKQSRSLSRMSWPGVLVLWSDPSLNRRVQPACFPRKKTDPSSTPAGWLKKKKKTFLEQGDLYGKEDRQAGWRRRRRRLAVQKDVY